MKSVSRFWGDKIDDFIIITICYKRKGFPGLIFMKEAKDYIIFPLDVPSLKEAKQFVKLLSEHVGQ